MREFYFKFDDGLRTGLRRTSRHPRGSEGLVDCYGFKPTESGAAFIESVNTPASGAAIDWPFPQMFDTTLGMFIAQEQSISAVDSTTWALTEKIGSVTAGTAWNVADFGAYQVWMNGKKTILNTDGSWSTFSGDEIPCGRALCNFRGQAIAGAFETEWTGGAASGNGVGLNGVAWSHIGHISFKPLYAVVDAEGTERLWRLNEAGFAPMSWPGEIYDIKPLGEGVVIYGSGGISAFIPVIGPKYAVGSWKLIDLIRLGTANRRAVGGDERQHIFVAEDGQLWVLGADYKLARLDYSEYLVPLLDEDIVVSYDVANREAYIANSSTGFLFNEFGMGELRQLPSDLIFTQGGLVAPNTVDQSDQSVYLVTDIIDLGLRGVKHIFGVEVGTDTDENLEVALDYRYNRANSFNRTAFTRVNGEGVAFVACSGVEFRIVIHVSEPEAGSISSFDIDYFTCRWQLSDKRDIRGTYGTDPLAPRTSSKVLAGD